MQKINNIKNSLPLDKTYLSLFGFFLCLCGIGLLYNQFHQNYAVNFQWESDNLFVTYSTLLLFYISSFWITPLSPYFGFILKSAGMIPLTWILLLIGNTTVFTTPFNSPYDHFFNHIDHDMGFYLLPLLQWVQQHSLINHLVWNLYLSVLCVLPLLPVALAIAKQYTAMYQFYFTAIIVSLIAYSIYYFFPTTSPASVNTSLYFLPDQINLLHYFQLEHIHQFFNFNMVAIIGFPSLHAAWTILLIYFLWQYRFIKYVGLIYGLFVVIAIILTGWHFLSDIIAGCIVAMIALKITERLV